MTSLVIGQILQSKFSGYSFGVNLRHGVTLQKNTQQFTHSEKLNGFINNYYTYSEKLNGFIKNYDTYSEKLNGFYQIIMTHNTAEKSNGFIKNHDTYSEKLNDKVISM